MKICTKFQQLYKDLLTLDYWLLVPVEVIIPDKICLLVAILHGIPITIILKVIQLLQIMFVVLIEIQELLDEILESGASKA